jgi:hypothetical protein
VAGFLHTFDPGCENDTVLQQAAHLLCFSCQGRKHNSKVNESNMQSQVMPRMTIKDNDQSVTIEICN